MATIHYGLPGYRAACGHMRNSVSADKSNVSCERCKLTRQWALSWFRR